MKNTKSHLGVIYVILSAILFGTMPLLTRIAYTHGSNAYTVAFGRFFFGSSILGLICFVLLGCSIKIKMEQFLELVKLSIPYALMPILLYASYTYIDSGIATALHFTYPVAVMLIMALFFKSQPDAKQLICAVLCIGGSALLYTPNGQVRVVGIILKVLSKNFTLLYLRFGFLCCPH
jgi:drug/metabolite transporter (DMT)-like permease